MAAALGRAAYPLFLLHWAVSVVVSVGLFQGRVNFDMPGAGAGPGYFAAVLCASIASALVLVQVVDRPMERLRRVVRARARRAVASTSAAPDGV